MYNKLYDKQRELNKRNDRIATFLVAVILFYFFASKATITGIQFGPIGFNDLSIIIKLSPLLFSYLVLEYAIINAHRAEVIKLLKWINMIIHNQKLSDKSLKEPYLTDLTRLILPYSLSTEVSRINDYNNDFKWLDIILIIPLLALLLFPFWFEIISIRYVIANYWHDWLGKTSVILSVWLIFVVVYFYIKLIRRNMETQKKDLV